MDFKILETKEQKPSSATLREFISTAAYQVFAQLGIEDATTNKIADRAGVSIGSVYRHFRNKYNLFDHLTERIIEAKRERIRVFLEKSKGSSLESLGSAMAGFVYDGLMQDRSFLKVLYSRIIGRNTAVLWESRKKIAMMFSAHLREHYAHEVDISRVDETMIILINAFTGVLMMTISAPSGSIDLARVRSELMTMSSVYLCSLRVSRE